MRTPLLPLDTLVQWPRADVTAARRYLAALIDRPEIDDALYVASPGLHGELARWRAAPDSPAGAKVELSLVRYVARASGRATPFGLFSGVSVGTLGGASTMTLAPLAAYRRRTRLDNDYLYALCDALCGDADVRAGSTFRPNSSLYTVGGHVRYAEARLDGAVRTYHLVSVERTPYLDATLARARAGASLRDLAAALAAEDADVAPDEAQVYVDELVSAQVLVPGLAVAVTGLEPLDHLLRQLEGLGGELVATARATLTAVQESLAAIDADGLGVAPARYEAIAASLAALPVPVERSRLFQVDMVKPATATLAPRLAAEVVRAMEWLQQVTRSAQPASLDELARRFRDRYEGREVPLCEALDEESGIGFESDHGPGAEGAPLLAGLMFPAAGSASAPSFRAADAHLLRRVVAAVAAGEAELALDDADLAAMRSDAQVTFAGALSAIIRVVGAGDEAVAFLHSAIGPSGARALGRFCHASPEIDALVRAHLRNEEALAPDAVFAEIVHLNEGRIGNLVCRPVLRDHEIVFLGTSGAPVERQLTVDDLYLSMRGDRFVITSRRLGREVIPRMSTAHNFRLRSLPLYRFLNVVQHQQAVGGVSFSWGPLDALPFLPRVRIGRVVVARARWRLDAAELAPITAAVREAASKLGQKRPVDERRLAVASTIRALRDRRRLPRFVVVSEQDNELPIDLDNPLLVAVLAEELAGSDSATLTELYPAPDAAAVTGPEGGFASEVILTMVRTPTAVTAATPSPSSAPRRASSVPRDLAPGSSWLYAKLYSGVSTADLLLRDAIAPVVRAVLARHDASHWFFIRYADPEPHLRVRFAGDPARLAAGVLPALHDALAPYLADGELSRVQLDTYQREVERYGGDAGIELCERLFAIDSDAILAIIERLEGDDGAVARWQLALRGADLLLESCGIPAEGRERIFTEARDFLGREHGATAAFYAQLGERYRREAGTVDVLLSRDPDRDRDHDLAPGFEILAAAAARMAPVVAELRALDDAGHLAPRLGQFAWSLVHMRCNRLLHASHRAQELVLYDFLRRWHGGRRARARGKVGAR